MRSVFIDREDEEECMSPSTSYKDCLEAKLQFVEHNQGVRIHKIFV
jgi:hypothetical protein